ncbi:MAG: NAD+ synthase [Caldithrix sp.]|nr:NAD+ synthase [Caldithrix sp.]
MLTINPEMVTTMLLEFLRDEVRKIGMEKTVLGLSGGVDSAVVAALLQKAMGKENVHALIMPFRESNPDSRRHAELMAHKLNISFEVLDVSPMVDAFFANNADADIIRRGNKMARERMCLLYDYSSAHQALVIGTSNKTELMLGYSTIHGDVASAINPIGDLYKTQIWALAEYLQIPPEIIKKAPSADLWVGQTDEEELGYTYEQMDELLYYMIDMRYPDEIMQDMGYEAKVLQDIRLRIQKSQFKRRPPVIAKLTNRTINQDFRYCRDWGV